MRPIVTTYSGPTSPLPVDIYMPKAEFFATVSGTGLFQYTNNDPYSLTVPLSWTAVSPGHIQLPVRAFRMASGQGTLLLTQYGPVGGGG